MLKRDYIYSDMSRFFTAGIPVDDNTLALKVIEKVGTGGPGSIFLTEDHTFENYEKANFLPDLLDRSRYDAWESAGSMDMYKRCNAEAKRILAEHQVELKTDEVIKEIERIIANY